MAERSTDWIKQSEKDIEAAKALMQSGHYEWSCFVSQQAAEKAFEAVFQKLNGEARGHSVVGLAKALGERFKIEHELIDCCRVLDRYYIPTRYPNGFEKGSPFEYYTKNEAEHAIVCAGRILSWSQGVLA